MLSFAGIVVAPCGLYLSTAHAAWTVGYAFDPEGLPGFVALVGVGLPVLAVGAGYAGGWLLVRHKGVRALRLALAAGLLGLAVAALLAHGRVWQEGTYAAFRRGDALPLSRTKLFFELVIFGAGCGAAAVLVGRALRGEARRKPLDGAARRR